MYDHIRIETPQLIIRNFNGDDIDCLQALVNAEEIMTFVPFTRSRTRPECENLLHNIMMKRYKESTPDHFVGFILLVVSKETGQGIGFVGLCPLAYDRKEKELFYGIFKEVWGKGYGSEIAHALIQYGMETMALPKMMATVNEGNEISSRILIQAGMSYEKTIVEEDTDDSSYQNELLYVIDAAAYWHQKNNHVTKEV